jgi:N-acetylglucosaminyl-diphospho-decaprenol L-rhamnosyltransferase
METDLMSLHVAVAIVGFRNADDVSRCLRALGASSHADFEVVICENGGPEAHRALVAALPPALPGGQGVRIECAPRNLGFAGGVNLCLAAAPGADAWWVLNPDTEPQAGALAAMLARLGRGDCQAVGATLYLPDGTVQAYGGRWRAWLARPESIGHGRALVEAVDAAAVERAQNYLNGASMLLSREFLARVGPMREDYFLYCEEVEWCLRALARGLCLGFAPEALVLHHQGTTTGAGSDPKRRPRLPIYLDERNKVLLTRDRFPARLPVAAVAAFLLSAARYARRGAWRQWGHALAGWWAGLRDERGPPAWFAQ